MSWMSATAFSNECPVRRAPSKGQRVVQAMSVVVEEMLLMKYGLALDGPDFVRKVWSHCRGESSGDKLPSAAEVISQLNVRSADLRFRTLDSESSIALHVESRILASFQDLQAEVRRMPGTARALAMVVPLSLDLRTPADEEDKTRAVAVFREDYGRPTSLVGRDSAPGAQAPLNSFSAVNLLSALVLDPVVDKVYRRDPSATAAAGDAETISAGPPPLRDEYASLGVWLLPEESQRKSTATAQVSHVAVLPWNQVLEAAASEGGGPAATQEWMWRMRRILDHPDAAGEAVLPLLAQICTWFDGDDELADTVKHAVSAAGLQPGLVRMVQRALAEPEETSGGMRRTDLAVAECAARLIGLCSKGPPESATSFAEAGAVAALCGLMQRWPEDGDAQFSAICALGTMSEEDVEVAATALSAGVLHLVRAAVNAHPGNAELQRCGTRALQHFSNVAAAVPPPGGSSPSDGTLPGQETNKDDESDKRSNRKGLAAALLEKRAAEQQPSMVSTAVGWLFSGQTGSAPASARQGNNSELPNGRTQAGIPSAQLVAPAPFLPTPGGIPRLEVQSARTVQSADSWRTPGVTALSSTPGVTAVSGRRATSKALPSPVVATAAHDNDMSRDESPFTPAAVRNRMQLREQKDAEHPDSTQVPAQPIDSLFNRRRE